tara:strand:- start:267 stop:389 length:123 start_codon:yes stop_codon:yes gene_type:complete
MGILKMEVVEVVLVQLVLKQVPLLQVVRLIKQGQVVLVHL